MAVMVRLVASLLVVRSSWFAPRGSLALHFANTLTATCRYADLGKFIQRTAEKQRMSVVKTYCGHGIGSCFHCRPNVPHYKNNRARGVMKEGHVFTVEPMINLGSYDDMTWGDDWSAR